MPAKYAYLGAHALHYLHTGPTTLPTVPPALDRGTAFLLLHAGGGCAAMWQRTLAALAERHSAVAVDLPAHGRSNGIDGLATIDAMAECLAGFVEAIRLRRFVLVGWSLGASVAIAWAARQPAKLRGLVLAAPASKPDLSAALPPLRDVVRGRAPQQFTPEMFSPQSTPDVMREFFTTFVTTDPRVRLADFEAAHGWDATPHLAKIGLPTLVLAGADDRVTPSEHSQAVAAAVRGARFEVIAAAGHALPVEQPAATAAALASFAEGLP